MVKFSGPDVDLLLSNRAELLLALEHVTMEMLRMPSEDHSRISFDANDYRLLRIEELRLSAMTAAEKVKRTRRAVPLQSHEQPRAPRDPPGPAQRNRRAQREHRHRSAAPGGGSSAGMASLPEPSVPRAESAARAAALRRPRSQVRTAASGGGGSGGRRAVTCALEDTIVAISTPPGRAGLGVVRLSGAEARRIAESILRFRRRPAPLDAPHWPNCSTIPRAMRSTRWWSPSSRRPRSYTAEDVVEISCHGSPVVLRHARGARAARPARGWPSPASSRCAPSSTAASTCRRPKPSAT